MRARERVLMVGVRCLWALALCASIGGVAGISLAAETSFPSMANYASTPADAGLQAHADMDIAAKGAIVLEMWCNRVDGQVVVAGDTITVMTGQPTERPARRSGPGRRRSAEPR